MYTGVNVSLIKRIVFIQQCAALSISQNIKVEVMCQFLPECRFYRLENGTSNNLFFELS